MKRINTRSIVVVFGCALIVGLAGLITALAATTPSLGTAVTYGVLASTYTNTTAGTVINGDLGYTTGPAVTPTVTGTTHVADASYTQAGTDRAAALSSLNAQPCDFNFGSTTDLSLLSQPLTPGVYCIAAAASVGTGGITLNGNGTYIFRINGALTTVANSAVSLSGGASACNVFWTPTSATTLGANSSFVGTNIDTAGITMGSNVSWSGRALAFGGTITTDTDIITVPTCTITPPPPPVLATLHIIKQVVNNNGGTATASSFNLHVKSGGTDVAGSPAAGTVAPGTLYSLSNGSYTVSEDANSAYVSSFSGDCDSSGNVTFASGNSKVCIVTNTDIAPVLATLHVIKVVVNGSGGTAVSSNFNLHVKNSNIDVSGSPAVGAIAPGTLYSLSVGTYVVSEDSNTAYTQTFSGDCDATGTVVLAATNNKICTVTNTAITVIPPVIAPTVIVPPVVPLIAAPTPLLPNTGLAPQETKTPWNAIMLSSIVVIVLSSVLVLRKNTV